MRGRLQLRSQMGWVACWLLLLVNPPLWSEEMELDSGTTLQVSRFDAPGKSVVIWLPSERGFERDFTELGEAIAAKGQAVWVANFHESYMIPAGRLSIEQFATEDVVSLISKAGTAGYDQVAIFAASRGARLALRGSRSWQESAVRSPRLLGIISLYPNLTVDGQELGEEVRYLPLARSYNLPFYLLQPEFSTKYAHVGEIVAALEEGGSPVFLHRLPGAQGGFHVRPDGELSQADIEAKARFPAMLKQAVNLLASQSPPTSIPPLAVDQMSSQSEVVPFFSGGLQPYESDSKHAAIVLQDLSGNRVNSDDWRGETVLLNFWATWCGPCVHEIPSLSRLQQRMADRPFRIVSVNIGESAERIKAFSKKVPIDFPVLLDEDSQTARDWNIYAYPSNYLLDPDGNVTHAYRGALEWDDEEVVQSIMKAME